MSPSDSVQRFERRFADYVGAEYCIALCNGTATLHTALLALGVKPGDRVAVPPLTMSSTTIAVLQAGAVPVFVDVDPKMWLMGLMSGDPDRVAALIKMWLMGLMSGDPDRVAALIPVSLYGLHSNWAGDMVIDDAAQTLRPHGHAQFTSYSFQSSKILSCGEGGALVTNDKHLAQEAREISSLGYKLAADQPTINSSVIRSPTYQRHHRAVSWNYRLAPLLAEHLLAQDWDALKETRQRCASLYREAIKGCDWLVPQYVPEGWTHDYWAYPVAVNLYGVGMLTVLQRKIQEHGGEVPYTAWLPSYLEPAFAHLGGLGQCPIVELLQERILAFQTNDVASAMSNARALKRAIEEIG